MNNQPRRRPRVSVAVTALAVALSISCDKTSTAPDSGVRTHPAGTVSGRLAIAGSPSGIAVSPSGTAYVTLLDKNELARFAAAAPTSLASSIPLAVWPWDVVFNRAGTTAFVAAFDADRSCVYSVDVGAGTVPYARPMDGPAYRTALSPDEKRLYVLMYSDPAAVHSYSVSGTLDDQASYMVLVPGRPRAIAVSPATGEVFVTTQYRVARLAATTLDIRAQTGPVPVVSQDVVISHDGSRVWFGGTGGKLFAFDAGPLELVDSVAVGADTYGLAMSPDGTQLWATSLGDLLVVDPARAAISTRLTLGGTAAHIAFDRAGTTAFVANESGWVDVIR
jgi:DNA-binding beta-propeller fold protein YncE